MFQSSPSGEYHKVKTFIITQVKSEKITKSLTSYYGNMPIVSLKLNC